MQITISPSFELAYRFVTETSQNLFLTGKAGTGKTTFLKYLKERYPGNMVVAAPTGVAAINAGGVTLHSLFQLPFGPFIPETSKNPNEEVSQDRADNSPVNSHSLLARLRYNKEKLNLLRNMDLLVIDEASMVACHTVDAIDTILRSVKRRRELPFGGTQLLFIGDLYQLPPVVKGQEWNLLRTYYPSPFFFDSLVLRQHIPVMVELKKIYRQQDEAFIKILNGIRNNELERASLDLLNSRLQPSAPDSEGYITLTTHNHQADEINKKKLAQLDGKVLSYEAKVNGDFPPHTYPADEKLELKKGAQVMFLKNDTEEKLYFNGKIGVVTYLDEDEIRVNCEGERHEIHVKKEVWKNMNYSVNEDTREVKEEELGQFEQYPLRLAWAITIHKSQGLTFNKLIVDAENAFANGQVYVALSRCTSLAGLVLTSPVSQKFLGAHQNLKDWQESNHDENNLDSKFAQSRQQHVQHELQGVFSWGNWHYALKDLSEVFVEFNEYLPKDSLHWLPALTNKQRELEDVAAKFRDRVVIMCRENPIVEENKALQQRVKDAANYFSTEISQWQETFIAHPLITDTKKVARKLDKALEDVNFAVHEIMQQINYCKNGFFLSEFLEKAKKVHISPPDISSTYAKNQKSDVSAQVTEHKELYDALAEFRRKVSNEHDIPIYRVFRNTAIEGICEKLPGTKDALMQIKGFGKATIKQYGDEVLTIILDYCEDKGLQTQTILDFAPKKEKKEKGSTVEKTLEYFREGKNIREIAQERNLAATTIEGHLSEGIKQGKVEITDLMPMPEVEEISALIPSNGSYVSLNALKQQLPDSITYGQIKMVLAWLQREG